MKCQEARGAGETEALRPRGLDAYGQRRYNMDSRNIIKHRGRRKAEMRNEVFPVPYNLIWVMPT